MTTDTPRTDSCPHCGSQTEVDSFFRTTCGNLLDYREGNIGKIAGERTDLCHEIEVSNLWRKRAEKAEAEVKAIRAALGDDLLEWKISNCTLRAEVERLKEQLESTKLLALKFWKVLEENGFKIELPK